MVNVTVVKTGVIASSLFIDILFDERGARDDIRIRAITSGCNMDEEQALDLAENALKLPTDLYIIISPAASMGGPSKLRDKLKGTGKPIIVVTDGDKKVAEMGKEESWGYIVVKVDPMIGAKKQFLDPQEMVLFNGHVLTVLSAIGLVRAFQKLITPVIEGIKNNSSYELPKIELDAYNITKFAEFSNPYAEGKAIAAGRMMINAAATNRKATWSIKDHDKSMNVCVAGHETVRQAALLAMEALEIEKANNGVFRTVFEKDGKISKKRKLYDKVE